MSALAFHTNWRRYCSTVGPDCVRWWVLSTLVGVAVVVTLYLVFQWGPTIWARLQAWWWLLRIGWPGDGR